MYAKDTHGTLISNNIDGLITSTHKELRNILEWMRVNQLSANPQKTEYIVIDHPHRVNKVKMLESLNLNDSEIERVAYILNQKWLSWTKG